MGVVAVVRHTKEGKIIKALVSEESLDKAVSNGWSLEKDESKDKEEKPLLKKNKK